MADVTLYTNPMSRGRIARWMLEEAGAPYEVVVMPFGPDGTQGADFRAINPMGKLPTIRHGGKVITEAAAICAYLADAFPDAGLAPPLAERASYYRWLFFGAGCIEPAATARAQKTVVPPEASSMIGWGSPERVFDTLEEALAGKDYIAGYEFSAADVYVGSQVLWGLQFDTIDRRPAFEAYAARVADRDAYRRSNELDDADAAAMSA
ncbi:glutathione S-transferase family protein [Acuticoccus sp.]|uniref:glutathione S-transferase family protein n=1 Tax=Acuticoccus sp. TaxID=1904378 RepID=UPI003B52C139